MQLSWAEIKDKWSNTYPLGNTSWEKIPSIGQIIHVMQGDRSKTLKNHSQYEIFIAKGVLRTFTSSNGKEYTSNFYLEDDFIIPVFARKAYELEIEPLEDSVIVVIDEKRFTSLRHEFEDLRELGNKVVEKELFLKSKKEVLMATMNLETLYDFFLDSFPGLSNRIPQRYIASYLGVNPVSLSRLRNRITARRTYS